MSIEGELKKLALVDGFMAVDPDGLYRLRGTVAGVVHDAYEAGAREAYERAVAIADRMFNPALIAAAIRGLIPDSPEGASPAPSSQEEKRIAELESRLRNELDTTQALLRESDWLVATITELKQALRTVQLSITKNWTLSDVQTRPRWAARETALSIIDAALGKEQG